MDQYAHGGDIYGGVSVELDYSVNTNPLGMPEAVKRAIIDHIDTYERYPDPYCRALRAALSGAEGVPAEQILCGNGAADLIFRLCLARRPKRVLVCAPTFSEYEKAAALAGAEIVYHTLAEAEGFVLTDRILGDITADVDMVFLCTPNNPTGRLIPGALLRAAAARCGDCGCTLVLDECFLPFTDGVSMAAALAEFKHLVILKAFTKIYAMAGLRLGYMLTGDAALLARTAALAQHWSVSVPAQVAGLAALDTGDWTARSAAFIRAHRGPLVAALRGLGITVYDSDANYLLCRGSRDICPDLLDKGILVRSCANFEGLDARYFRVTVKGREMNRRLIQAIEEVYNG